MSAIHQSPDTSDPQLPPVPNGPATRDVGGDDWRARLDRVFRQNERAIRASALKRAKGRADDVIGHTFCKLVMSFDRVDDPIIPPATDEAMAKLVFRSLENAARDAHRRAATADAIFAPAVIDSIADGDGGEVSFIPADARDTGMVGAATDGGTEPERAGLLADEDAGDELAMQDLLDYALAQLTNTQYEVLTSMSFDQESRHEVAGRLGLSVRTVDAHLQAAYKRMRTLLLLDAPNADSDRVTEMVRQLGRRHLAGCAVRRNRKECRTLAAGPLTANAESTMAA